MQSEGKGQPISRIQEVLLCTSVLQLIRRYAMDRLALEVRGTRIPVYQIVRMLANGDTVEELLAEYPSLERDDIIACLNYAASLAEEQVTPIEALAGVA